MRDSILGRRSFLPRLLPLVVFAAIGIYFVFEERSAWGALYYIAPFLVNLLWRNRIFTIVLGAVAAIFCAYMVMATLVMRASAALILLYCLGTLVCVAMIVSAAKNRNGD